MISCFDGEEGEESLFEWPSFRVPLAKRRWIGRRLPPVTVAEVGRLTECCKREFLG